MAAERRTALREVLELRNIGVMFLTSLERLVKKGEQHVQAKRENFLLLLVQAVGRIKPWQAKTKQRICGRTGMICELDSQASSTCHNRACPWLTKTADILIRRAYRLLTLEGTTLCKTFFDLVGVTAVVTTRWPSVSVLTIT